MKLLRSLSIIASLLCLAGRAWAETPSPTKTLIEMKSVAEWKVVSNKVSAVVTPSPNAANRLSLQVPQAGEKAWDLCLHSAPFPQAIQKGEKIWLSFPVQDLQTSGTPARLIAYVEPIAGKGVKFQLGGAAMRSEMRIQETWTAEEAYEPGTLRLSLHLAQAAQHISLGPLQALIYAPETDATKLPVTPLTYAGREPEAPWRKAADERIRKHRMNDVKVKVMTLAGEPVPNAEIEWRQLSHAFGFGCFCEGELLKETPDGENYRKFFAENFNCATVPAYLAEWGWLKPEGRLTGLRIADWLEEKRIPARGHLLVYPGYVATPNAWRELPAAERRSRIEAHFAPVLHGLGERGVLEFDAVNELRDNIGFCDELGQPTQQSGLQVVADWFKQAKALAPNSILYINEYMILAGGGFTQKEQDLYFKTIEALLKLGAPIDGIGMQGHFGAALTPPDAMLAVLDRFATLGKKIRITEFDIDIGDEAAQADFTRDFYTLVYSHPAVEGIVQWGFWEGNQWKPRGAMIRKDWSEKPNYHAFRKLTRETLASHFKTNTSSSGEWSQRIHQGTHLLTIKVGNYTRQQTVQIHRSLPHLIEVRVP
jgi:endo-1,4-beta-xylanase